MKEYGIERSRTHEERKLDAMEMVGALKEDESMLILIVKETEDTVETKTHTTVRNEDMLTLISVLEKQVDSLKDKVKQDPRFLFEAFIKQFGDDFE